MKRIPIMLQWAFILFIVMAAPTALLTWYSGNQILGNSEDAIAESSLSGLNASRRLNENALNNLAQDAVRLTATNIFDRIRYFETYDEVNSNYNNVSDAQAVLRELRNLSKRVDGVYSSAFYLADSNYVISTDEGITPLERYESLNWMKEAVAGRRGIAGVWYPRKLDSGINVVSYVLPLNYLSTTTRGTIIVNMRESQIGEYLRSSEPGEQGYMLMNANGTIISNNDKSLLLSDGAELPFMRDILNQEGEEGYAFHEVDGERRLYTWSRSEIYDWVNVNIYSMDELMTKTNQVQRSMILLTVIILFAGTVLTVLLATWLSRPVRKLVRSIRSERNLGMTHKRNEFAFLDSAFKRMQEEEEGLYKMLQEREQDTRSLAVHNLLRGELDKQVDELFPESYFATAVVSIDQYRRYVSQTNPETRSYHRYHFISYCEGMFSGNIYARIVYQGGGCFAIVINYGQEEHEDELAAVKEAIGVISAQAAELFGHSVTIGISSCGDRAAEVSGQAAEAAEMIKYRMIEGGGGIMFWRKEEDRNEKYLYPANSERRILNFLDSGDLESIIQELEAIREDIHAARHITYDNILFIYNQLAGVTIKHLRENKISTARIFAGWGNMYSAIASLDTLDELNEYLHEFYGEIVEYLTRDSGETNYVERIIAYLEEHYREDIVFEEMAKEIGISYSYMRKIVCEATGKSLIDYTNSLRIERAKQLLLETKLNMTQIASQVGYFNVQSFNRFFRKYEGMPPSSYKASRAGA
ncbi:AraC family transcriptional regulator [Paenibacillus sp. HB172176]|uniref:AraC family transcriptional regulator n=1 Tax=Paenibacillus sp. HB172176 TaxID=2493690 RepID=UPI00143AEB6B|nr:AraC family transcriptional regulator [Paenibacillus sp. HB172176]